MPIRHRGVCKRDHAGGFSKYERWEGEWYDGRAGLDEARSQLDAHIRDVHAVYNVATFQDGFVESKEYLAKEVVIEED